MTTKDVNINIFILR